MSPFPSAWATKTSPGLPDSASSSSFHMLSEVTHGHPIKLVAHNAVTPRSHEHNGRRTVRTSVAVTKLHSTAKKTLEREKPTMHSQLALCSFAAAVISFPHNLVCKSLEPRLSVLVATPSGAPPAPLNLPHTNFRHPFNFCSVLFCSIFEQTIRMVLQLTLAGQSCSLRTASVML